MEDIEALIAEAVSREMEKFGKEIDQLKGETEKLKKENHELRVMVKTVIVLLKILYIATLYEGCSKSSRPNQEGKRILRRNAVWGMWRY